MPPPPNTAAANLGDSFANSINRGATLVATPVAPSPETTPPANSSEPAFQGLSAAYWRRCSRSAFNLLAAASEASSWLAPAARAFV